MTMEQGRTWTALLCAVLGLAGCAGYKVEKDGLGCGYDVYRPEPYVKVTPMKVADTTSKEFIYYNCEIIWLPNYGQRYRVHSWAGFGTANFEFTFAEGWKLTALNDRSNNTNVLADIMGLVKHVLPADPFGVKADTPGTAAEAQILNCKPILYRIDFDEQGRPSCLSQLDVRLLPCPPGGTSKGDGGLDCGSFRAEPGKQAPGAPATATPQG